jgi:hypothetical protein
MSRDHAMGNVSHRTAVIAVSILVGSLCGCKEGASPGDPRVAARLLISPASAVVPQDDGVQVGVKVVDQYGFLLPDTGVTLTARDTSLLTVLLPSRVARAHGRSGQTELVVSAGSLSRSIPVVITQVLSAISFVPHPTTIAQFDSIRLMPTARDARGDQVAGAAFAYSTSDSSFATVSPDGVVRARGRIGDFTIAVVASHLGKSFSGGIAITIVPKGP